ncbi:protein translocase subunit SecD [Schaalia sp. 19OD2882]|uniref:protein translocase subunit SecD n=1 Tax=Schaalia sp. 19OD2882 TaxID=2794089 RepID=UPI001C1EEFF9|nr:protein translocase subunit SecD [Schaalia sp. 19OD2882]QWW20472.1 protein translocase subunit SecD [Schaalia sp. 19OD2882]
MASNRRHPLRALLTLVVLSVIGVGALVIGNVTGNGASYTPKLALDLEGGTQLILTPVSTEQSGRAVTEADIAEAINIIRSRVDASGVAEAEITSLGQENIVVAIPGRPSQETLDLIRSSSQMNFRPVLQIVQATTQVPVTATPSVNASGAQSGQAPQSAAANTTEQSGQSAAAEQSGAGAQSGDTAQSFRVVQNVLPEDQATKLADRNQDGTLADAPQSTPANNSDMSWVTEKALFDLYTLDCTKPGRVEGAADKPYAACDDSGQIKYLLGPVDVSGANLDKAAAGLGTNSQGQPTGEWVVSLQFDAEGTKAFAASSQTLFGFQKSDPEGGAAFGSPDRNHFAVVLDGKVITAPSMNAIISTGMAEISGSFTAASATALANQLSFGSLPLNFEVQSEQQISATLGSEHLEKGLWAGLIGLILVVAYLLWQYRGLSIVATGSLLVAAFLTYLVITLLSWTMGYRLSLAGIAGLIVAVGVTADSFIVYFERIRDEVRDGRPLLAAVSEGWDRAKRTIIVSDAVNLVAAVVLYVLAVGGVQGFAFTLGVTTVVDLFVIFLFTHPVMELLIRTEFFGGGHKLSGLDPEHLGAKNALVYAGRGRFTTAGVRAAAREKGASVEDALSVEDRPMSLAERRRAEREAATASTAAASVATEETLGGVEDSEQVQKEDEQR